MWAPTIAEWFELVHRDERVEFRDWLLDGDADALEIPRRIRMDVADTTGVVEVGAFLAARDRLVGYMQLVAPHDTTSVEGALRARAEHIGGLGGWQIDIATGATTVTTGWRDVLGFPGTEEVSVADALAPVHPDDRDAVLEFFRGLRDGQTLAPLVYRFRRDHRWRWLEARGERVDDTLTGFVQDVTDRVTAQRTLEAHVARLELAEAIAELGTWEYDATDDVVRWSRGLATLDEACDGAPSGRSALGRVHPDDQPVIRDYVTAVLAGNDPEPVEIQINHPNGLRWCETRARLVRPAVVVGAFLDTTRRRAIQRRFFEQTVTLHDEINAKTAFLSRMNHELRTPLHSILGYTQLLELSSLDADDRSSIEQIRTASNHLLALINDILDLTSTESTNLTVAADPVDLIEVVNEAINVMRPMADARGIALNTPCRSDTVTAFADRRRTLQILLNLLSNAVKYNRDHGVVTVTIENRHDRTTVTVSDTGRGFTPADAQRAFEPFERVGAQHSDIEGTGIGLFLARSLAERMHGTLTLHSTPGHGSTFTLDLPAHPN